jgi:hypothetical protein
MRLTVSWRDGAVPRGFTVTTHLLVLNPRAPNGARGDNPEVPPNLMMGVQQPTTPGGQQSTTPGGQQSTTPAGAKP